MTQPAAYSHNGQPVSAQVFYAIACDPRRSVVVQACAGAGKTWMLVSRMLRALLEGAKPQEILAITFTKKAAGEIRERLLQWLQAFADADAPTLQRALQERGITSDNSHQPLPELTIALSKLYQSLLDQDRSPQIRTFHSWFAALLRSAPISVLLRLGLPVDYELLEDDTPAKAAVWRHFYESLLGHPHLLADYEAVVYEVGRYQTEKALEAALDKRTEFLLADAHGRVEDAVQAFGQQFPVFAALRSPDDFFLTDPSNRSCLLAAAKALGAASAPTVAAKGAALEAALATGDVDAMLAALLTQTQTPRKFSEKLNGFVHIQAAQALAVQLLPARHQHACWLYQQRLTRLTRLLLTCFAQIKREQGWVDMNDIERAASSLLGDSVLFGWIGERLDAQIRHLLIDEFQDTNPLQWQALKSWLGAYAGAGGHAPSVFMVGDPKQSIYRFRRAEPQVFLAAQAFVEQALGGDILTCDHTRRNDIGVLTVVNAVMSDAAQTDGYPGFREHTTDSPHLGWVQRLPQVSRTPSAAQASDGAEQKAAQLAAHAAAQGAVWRNSLSTPRDELEETLRTVEARQAAAWIAGLLAQEVKNDGTSLQSRDVMVLSRKRAALVCLQTELRKAGIAAQLGEKVELIACCEVQDLLALMDVLVSPKHSLSLVRVLKSPLFDIDDAALVELAMLQPAPPQPPLPWFDLLQKNELTTNDGRTVSQVLMLWKDWVSQLPPHDALQAIYFDGDVLARFARAAPRDQRLLVQNNLQALLGVCLQIDGGRYASPYALVRKLKAGGVLASAALQENAVQLMTIHGAKGLEAHAVLLLDTDAQERNAQSMGVLVDWPGSSEWPLRFVFMQSESRPPACAVELLAREIAEREREEINALYVAMTRAKSLLALSSIEPRHAAERSWWSRLYPLAGACSPQALQAPAAMQRPQSNASNPQNPNFFIQELPMIAAKPSPVIQNNQADAAEQLVSEQSAALGQADDSNADHAPTGLAMHRLLEWGAVSEQNTRAVAQEFELTSDEAALAAQMAQTILQGQGAWAWDSTALAWQGNEVELMYQGEPLRIDRLVQRKDAMHQDEWWVLDYKMTYTPQEQPELMAQLGHYRDAVQAIYPTAVVRAAFLTGAGLQVELKAAE
jgi:ATP-dependent helicase/nuclease subunit A